jgi:hypothetical protein
LRKITNWRELLSNRLRAIDAPKMDASLIIKIVK